jgi:hypothetical protein
VIDSRLGEIARALIEARPSFYAHWLRQTFVLGVTRMVSNNYVLRWLAPVLAVLVFVWLTSSIVRRLRTGPVAARARAHAARSYSFELNVTLLLAVSFALAKLLQLILVTAPQDRYVDAAGIFLPSVAVGALFALAARIFAPLATTSGGEAVRMVDGSSPLAVPTSSLATMENRGK